MTASILEAPFTAPPSIAGATWSTVPGSPAATLTDITINGVAGIRIASSGLTVTSVKGLVRAKPATLWTATARIRRHVPMGSNVSYGLLLRESATGKMQLFGWTPSGVGDVRFSSASVLTGTDNWIGNAAGSYCPWEGWLRVTRAASLYQYYVSADGNSWSLIKSYAFTGPGFTSEADQVGVGLNLFYVTPVQGAGLALDTFSWQLSSP